MGEKKGGERGRDHIAFIALLAFVGVVYVAPGEWIEALAPLRLALATSVVAAALVLLRRLSKGEALYIDGLRGAALMGLAALSLASTAWSVNPEASRFASVELLKLVAIYLTLINVVNTPARLRKMCLALVLFSSVASIGVIRWRLSGSPLVEGFRSRWVGVYSDPNHMAMDIGMIVPLALSFVLGRENRMLLRVAAALSAVLAVCAIILSHSRGGFLGLCAGLAVWTFIARRRWKAVLLAAAFVIGLAMFAPASFWQRTESLTAFREDPSALGRVYAWQVASEINRDKPLLGVGVGGFRYAWPLYAPPEATHAYVAHNVFLDVLGDLGFFGLLLFLVFTGGVAGGVFRAARQPGMSTVGAALAASVAGYLVCDLFSGYILSAHFYILFGLAACADQIARAKQSAVLELPWPAPADAWAPSRALKA